MADRWFHGEQVQIDGSGDVGCAMYARRGQFLRAEAALQPSLCIAAAAPASSFGISTVTARTTVRRPAASEGEDGRGIAGRAQEQMRAAYGHVCAVTVQ